MLNSPMLLDQKLGYLDPGSGSYLLQLLIGGLLGALFLLRAYWGRVKGFFIKRFTSGKAPSEDEFD